MSASTAERGLLDTIKFTPDPTTQHDAPVPQPTVKTVVPEPAPLTHKAPDPTTDPNAVKTPEAPKTPSDASETPKKPFSPFDIETSATPKSDANAEESDALAEKHKAAFEKATPSVNKAFQESRLEAKELKAKIKELEAKTSTIDPEASKQVDALKVQLEELKKINPETVKLELEQIRKERDDLNNKLKVADLKSTPEYQESFEKPIERATKDLADFAKKNKLSVSDFMEALSKTDRMERADILDPILESLSPYKQQAIMETFKVLDDLIPKRDTALKNADIAKQVIEDNRRKQGQQTNEQFIEQTKLARERSIADYQKASDLAYAELSKKLPIFQKFDGQDEHNKWVDNAVKTARGLDLYALTPKDQALAMMYATSFEGVFNLAKSASARVRELETVLAAKTKGTPNSNGTVGGDGGATKPDERGLVEVIAGSLGRSAGSR